MCAPDADCYSGCNCNVGFVKEFHHPFANCVLPQECDNDDNECPIEESFDACASATCYQTCETIKSGGIAECPDVPCEGGCLCRDGFVRETDQNSPCIPIAQCDQVTNNNAIVDFIFDISGDPNTAVDMLWTQINGVVQNISDDWGFPFEVKYGHAADEGVTNIDVTNLPHHHFPIRIVVQECFKLFR